MLRILKIFIVISTFALHLRNQSIQIKTPDLTGKFITMIFYFRTSLWICSMEKNRTHSFRWVKCQFAISNNYKLWVMITIRNVTGFRWVTSTRTNIIGAIQSKGVSHKSIHSNDSSNGKGQSHRSWEWNFSCILYFQLHMW